MKNHLIKRATKMLMIPTLIVGVASACGYNDGARTNVYDGTRTNGYGTNNYNGTRTNGYNANNYNGPGTNGYGTNNYNGPGTNGYGTNNYNGYGANNYNGVGPYATNYNNGVRSNGVGTNHRVAERVADVAEDVPGVSRATALVSGNDIVVGIDSSNRKNARALEKEVRRKVKSKEPGYNVHVTSDTNIHTRIRTAYTNMRNDTTNTVTPGHPVRDMGADVANIIRDIGRTATAPYR